MSDLEFVSHVVFKFFLFSWYISDENDNKSWMCCFNSLSRDLLPVHNETKFIVYKQCLAELLQCCPVCGLSCEVTWQVMGTFVSTAQQCSNCSFARKWTSQPMIRDYPAGNLLVSAAVYMNGASFSKMSRVFASLNLASISSSTFYRHIQQFVQPTILSVWNSHQQQLIYCMAQRSGSLILGGAMRADSPGHCAKYGCYTMMDLTGNRVVNISLIQVRETVLSQLL